jgi:digalactosyldiacylglycerol synthase
MYGTCRHTNYLAYVKEGPTGTGFLNAAAVYRINRWVCRIHCHKNVKLSDAVQSLPHQVTIQQCPLMLR